MSVAIIIAYSIIKSKQIRLRPTEDTDRGAYDPLRGMTMKAFTHLKVSRNGAAQRFILPKQACGDQSLFKDSP